MSTPGAVPATMGRRLLAYVVDALTALVVGGAFVLAGMLPLLRSLQDPAAAPVGASPLLLVGYALTTALGLFQWWYLGTRGFTVGKRVVGLRVLSATTGRPVGMGRALLRLLVPAAGSLVLGIGQLVVHLSPFFDSSGRRQGWHDKAAGTMVFDISVGLDPTVAGTVSAPDAARRMDALLTPPVPAGPPAPLAASPFAPVPAEPFMPVVPAASAEPFDPTAPTPTEPTVVPPPAAPPVYVTTVTAPDVTPRPVAEKGSSGPVDLAPTLPGIISSVPGARPPAATSQPSPPPPVPAPASIPAEETTPSAVVASAVAAAAVRSGPAPLEDDVEHTRLTSASRRAVPEAPYRDSSPRATLHLWDDRRLTLDGTALVGRNPAPREGEQNPDRLLRVPDPARSVSKTHLALGVDAEGAWLRDRNSTNGTVVTLPDGQQILCAPEQKVRVPSGASVAFGDFWFTVVG